MNYIKISFLLLVTLTFFSCTPSKTVEAVIEDPVEEVIEPQPTCEFLGKVTDQSALDGCKWIIVLEDGKRLEPVSMVDKSFKFKAGQAIRLSYEKEMEMMSVCMSGMLVKVTCIEEIKK